MSNLQQALQITVEQTIAAPIETVWRAWTTPADICRWNAASDDWHTTRAEVDLRPGGRFVSRMEAKDGSVGFDFAVTYEIVELHRRIVYAMDDGRRADTTFEAQAGGVHVRTVFDAEGMHPVEMQKAGWQSILDNFARYVVSGLD
jgi:uncharacterized protein YndB with AHSA1/START domain